MGVPRRIVLGGLSRLPEMRGGGGGQWGQREYPGQRGCGSEIGGNSRPGGRELLAERIRTPLANA